MVCEGIGHDPLQCRAAGAGGRAAVGPAVGLAVAGERSIVFPTKTGAVGRTGLRWTFEKCLTFSFLRMYIFTDVNVHVLIGVYNFLHWCVNRFLHNTVKHHLLSLNVHSGVRS